MRCGLAAVAVPAGYRDQSRVARSSDAGLRRRLCGFVARAEIVVSRQNLPHLHLEYNSYEYSIIRLNDLNNVSRY